LFPASAIRKLYRLTGGIPRLINLLCDRALLGVYVQGKARVDTPTLAKAAGEVFGGAKRTLFIPGYDKLVAGVMIIVIGIALSALYYHYRTVPARKAAQIERRDITAGQVSERPRLDTLWWFDNRSTLWKEAGRQGVVMRDEDRWVRPGRLGSQPQSSEEVPGQKQNGQADGQVYDAAILSTGD
jgi:hypothetical protein